MTAYIRVREKGLHDDALVTRDEAALVLAKGGNKEEESLTILRGDNERQKIVCIAPIEAEERELVDPLGGQRRPNIYVGIEARNLVFLNSRKDPNLTTHLRVDVLTSGENNVQEIVGELNQVARDLRAVRGYDGEILDGFINAIEIHETLKSR